MKKKISEFKNFYKNNKNFKIDWEKTTKLHNKTKEELEIYFKKYPKSGKKVFIICNHCKKVQKMEYRYKSILCRECFDKLHKNKLIGKKFGD